MRVFQDGPLAFGAVRLSIVDVSGSDQPLRNESGTLALVYNGEIYNYKELRAGLRARGHSFRTQGDGEVILHLYEEDPRDFAAKLDGMFAFALWDSARQRLVLARDRFGIKPLFYSQAGRRIVFGSELKAILAFPGIRPELDEVSLGQYFTYRFPLLPRTIAKGILKLEPGKMLSISASGSVMTQFADPLSPQEGIGEGFEERFREAVLGTADEGGATGVFLSGGLDSSLIARILSAEEGIPKPNLFTVGYDTGGYEDERKHAAAVARDAGANHHTISLGISDVPDLMDQAVRCLDEPIYSTVSLSTFAVASLASRYGRVVLTGDGADELFLSYTYIRRAALVAKEGGDWKAEYLKLIGWLDPSLRAALLETPPGPSPFQDFPSSVPEEAIRWFEIKHRLPEYHLARMDRITMAHGIEARLPFLRTGFASWALSRPASELVASMDGKARLRRLYGEGAASPSLDRPKQPFTAPIGTWLSNPLKEQVLGLLLDSGSAADLGLKKAGLERLVGEFLCSGMHVNAIWGIFMACKWYEEAWRPALRGIASSGNANYPFDSQS